MGLINKYNEEDFRNKVRSSNHAIHEKYDELGDKVNYETLADSNVKTFSTPDQHINNRVGISQAGNVDISGEGNIDYTLRNKPAQDSINLFPIIEPGPKGELIHDGFDYKDLIKFKISVINPIDPEDIRVLLFRALLEDLSDDYTGGWNSYKYNGRAEKFWTYNEFDRKINFSFKIAAQSRQELIPLYQKLNYLVAQTAPEYSGNKRRMRGKFNRITIGEWVNDIPGFFTGINLKWSKAYPWEIKLEPGVTQHPHVLDVSCQFQPIHDFAPENREFDVNKAPFILPGAENVRQGNAEDNIVDNPAPDTPNPELEPIAIDPIILEPDNTRVATPQEPQFFLDPELRNLGGTQGAGGFAGGSFGGGGAGSNF